MPPKNQFSCDYSLTPVELPVFVSIIELMTNILYRATCWKMICLFFGTSLLLAQEKETAIPDYKIAHEKLIALGLPAIPQSAKWISLPNHNDDNQRQLDFKNKGSAWWFTPAGHTTSQTLAWGAVSSSELTKEAEQKLQTAKLPNLQDDIAQMQKALVNLKKNQTDQMREIFEYSGRIAPLAKVLIFATQLRQVGQVDAANSLTHELLTLSPAHNDHIIDTVISQLAEAQYKSITQQFSKDHNWTTYYENLRAVIARFPRGWTKRDAVALCLEQTAQRARGEQPPALVISNPKLQSLANELLLPPPEKTATDNELTFHGVDLRQYPKSEHENVKQQILTAIAQGYNVDEEGNDDAFRQLWLLEKIEVDANSDAITRIQSMGLDAIPALAAMVEDSTLTHLLNQDGGYDQDIYFNSENDPKQLYKSLNRPMSRGEIAVRLLALTLPNENNSLDSIPPADLATIAREFWKKYKDGKKWDMALAFLAGDEQQQRAAISALAESEEPAAYALLEKSILNMPSAIEHFNTILEYLRKNPKADPRFIEEFKNKLSAAAVAKGNDRHSYFESDKERKDHFDGMLKRIDMLTNKQTPQQIIAEILVSEPKTAEAAIESLMDILSNEPALEALMLLLQSAINAKDPAISIAFIQGAANLEFEHDSNIRQLSDAERTLWKTLLEDKRATNVEGPNGKDASSVSDVASSILYYTVAGEAYHEIRQWATVLKTTQEELIQSRAKNIVEGKPLPPWPDAKNVSADRMKEIVHSINGKNPQEILAIIDKLTPDETAAWMAWIANPEDIPHPDSLKQMKRAIVGRSKSFGQHFTDDPKVDGLENGFIATSESLLKWAEELSKSMEQKSRTAIWIHSDPIGRLGLIVAAAQIAIPEPEQEEAEQENENPQRKYYKIQNTLNLAITQLQDDEFTAVMVMMVQRGRRNIAVAWHLTDNKITRDEKFTPESLTEIIEGDDIGGDQRLSLQLQILHRKDYEKILSLMK